MRSFGGIGCAPSGDPPSGSPDEVAVLLPDFLQRVAIPFAAVQAEQRQNLRVLDADDLVLGGRTAEDQPGLRGRVARHHRVEQPLDRGVLLAVRADELLAAR